jgi:hypothetical protein
MSGTVRRFIRSEEAMTLLAFQRDKLTFQPQVIITALHLDKVNLISWLISKIINHCELRRKGAVATMDLLASKTAINKYMSSRALEFTSANSW